MKYRSGGMFRLIKIFPRCMKTLIPRCETIEFGKNATTWAINTIRHAKRWCGDACDFLFRLLYVSRKSKKCVMLTRRIVTHNHPWSTEQIMESPHEKKCTCKFFRKIFFRDIRWLSCDFFKQIRDFFVTFCWLFVTFC